MAVVGDKRDLRDPQILGKHLLENANAARGAYATKENPIPLSEVYDVHQQFLHVPDVSRDDSLCKVTVAAYRAELEARSDKYAQAALRDIDSGKGVQGYDDAGS